MTIIAKNQTASALALDQIPIPDQEIPASGQVTLTDYATISEIQEDEQLIAHITAGDAILNVDYRSWRVQHRFQYWRGWSRGL
jgi:multidrug efflux pump subunit AcrB